MRKDCLTCLFNIVTNSLTPQPVVHHACDVLVKNITDHPMPTVRRHIQDWIECTLVKGKKLHEQKTFVYLVNKLINSSKMTSRTIVRVC